MCGIMFTCYPSRPPSTSNASGQKDKTQTETSPKASSLLVEQDSSSNHAILRHRGPDASNYRSFSLSDEAESCMLGCVLGLRGPLTPQPLVHENGSALLWNGEIFGGIEVAEKENDTKLLWDHLLVCCTDEEILNVLQQIHGPWAFVFWQAEKKKLWFGRDMFGRRSLLWHLPSTQADSLILSSVALDGHKFTEIPSVGIFVLDFSSCPPACSQPFPEICLYPWLDCTWPGSSQLVLDTSESDLLAFLYPDTTCCLQVRVDKRGILSSWIPRINPSVPPEDGNTDVTVDPIDSSESLNKLLNEVMERKEDLGVLVEQLSRVLQAAVERRVRNLPQGWRRSAIHQTVAKTNALDQSVPVNNDTVTDELDKINGGEVSEANVAILFSGGLDSTVLAALADRCIPPDEPIDLLNVAFEQLPPKKNQIQKKSARCKHQQTQAYPESTLLPSEAAAAAAAVPGAGNYEEDNGIQTQTRSDDALCKSADLHQSKLTQNMDKGIFDPFNVPDRITGKIALSELNPYRKWNFIEVNVTQEELQTMRQRHIRQLIYPSTSVLDDSIGCAVWFAARGKGILGNGNGQKFSSQARVILCGMAADEQFAGYSRHRVRFNQGGWPSLLEEIQAEMWRISARNLGRDDRIITDHGKESRFPFLDEEFTEFVNSIPVYQRADLRLPRGIGEKLLLRLYALKLGLAKTACQPKRAIQFGSRIAKLDNKKEKGSDACDRLTEKL